MLFIGEKVGKGGYRRGHRRRSPRGHEPLRHRAPATPSPCWPPSEKGGLLNAPDIYMDKLVVGPVVARARWTSTRPSSDNLKAIAKALDREVHDLVVIVLDRPRHERLIADIRKAGARIRLIGDGDLSAGISAAVVGHRRARGDGHGRRARRRPHRGGHALPERRDPGQAGAHQGRPIASASRRWASTTSTGSTAPRTWRPGKSIIFAAPGVTDGALLRGVRFFGDGTAPHSGHDDGAAPGPLHRHDPRQGRSGRQDPVLMTSLGAGRARRPQPSARPVSPSAHARSSRPVRMPERQT